MARRLRWILIAVCASGMCARAAQAQEEEAAAPVAEAAAEPVARTPASPAADAPAAGKVGSAPDRGFVSSDRVGDVAEEDRRPEGRSLGVHGPDLVVGRLARFPPPDRLLLQSLHPRRPCRLRGPQSICECSLGWISTLLRTPYQRHYLVTRIASAG